ncbi:hypothetical protein K523DRAFT_356816 [Schizophyllum commune Tattone D]|nr:hypothetical protein K523DRAFT_356816 [Schizophyllum commune Tattone D]
MDTLVNLDVQENLQQWGVTLHPGTLFALPKGKIYQLQNASLAGRIKAQERTELLLSFSPAAEGLNVATLCVFTPSSVEQSVLSIKLGPSQSYELSIRGPNSVSVVGNCVGLLDYGSNTQRPSAQASAKQHPGSVVPAANQMPMPLPPPASEDPTNATASAVPRLTPASKLVIQGSKISGELGVRFSQQKSWCIRRKFSDIVIGNGQLPHEAVEMELLGTMVGVQRDIRASGPEVTSWIQSAGATNVPSEYQAIFAIAVNSIL